jgi:hypothetical protein
MNYPAMFSSEKIVKLAQDGICKIKEAILLVKIALI